MKSFVEFLKEKGFDSVADFELKQEAEKAGITMEYNNYLRSAMTESLEQKATKQDIEEAQKSTSSEIEDLGNSIVEIKNAQKEQGLTLTKYIESKEKLKEEISKSLNDTIKDNADEIIKVAKGQKENHFIHVKALDKNQHGASILKATTTNASVTNNDVAFMLADIGQLATRRTSALDVLPFRSVPRDRNGEIGYIDWDEATKVRAAAMRAENTTFPESEAAWQFYRKTLRKVADTIPYTDEFEYDNTTLTNELEAFLIRNVELLSDTQVVVGDGVAPNLEGMEASLTAYTPVASGITDASIYDLIVKLRESIEAQVGQKYRVNVAFMNIADINRYKLKKDADNNYIMPPFVGADGSVIDGVIVI